MPTTLSAPLIPDKIQFLPGTAFGLHQATALAVVSVKSIPEFSLEALFHQFSLFGISPPDAFAKTATAPEKLYASLVYFSGAVQRLSKITVSETYRVRAINGELLILAMPYVDATATTAVLSWINKASAHFLSHQVFNDTIDAPSGKLPEQLQSKLKQCSIPGVNNYRFLCAADQLKVPTRRMIPGIYAYGTGMYTRILNSSFLDSTSAIGAKLSGDKAYTAAVLRNCGLPAPTHALANGEAQALLLADKIGFPVVVKPADREQGVGVHANLCDAGEVKAAFKNARQFSNRILIEKYFDGTDHRLTVYGDQVLQVISKIPGGVVGDGIHTLSELVSEAQSSKENQRRLRDFDKPLLMLDAEALELARKSGLHADSVVPENTFVQLRRKANVSAGGTPMPVPLDQVHPDNLRLAVSAARALNLNLAGVDLLIPDIRQSWLDCGALICEVNSQPQISQSERPEIYADILRDLLGNTHSVPVWLCVTDSTIHSLPASFETPANVLIGYSNVSGNWSAGARTTSKHPNSFAAANALLNDRTIGGAVLCMTAMDLIRFGLPTINCESMLIDQQSDQVINEIISRYAGSLNADILIHGKHAASFPQLSFMRITPSADPFRLLAGRIGHFFAQRTVLSNPR